MSQEADVVKARELLEEFIEDIATDASEEVGVLTDLVTTYFDVNAGYFQEELHRFADSKNVEGYLDAAMTVAAMDLLVSSWPQLRERILKG